MSKPNSQPELRHQFETRHIGPSQIEADAMLGFVGARDVNELICQTIPASILDRSCLPSRVAMSETQALAKLKSIAKRNRVNVSLIGQGYYGTILPAPIQRNILENPAWYTAYTPYQPEISQGRLEALLNFQTMVCDLTGLDVANASLLDEATAAAEAMAMAQRVATSKSTSFFVDVGCHPQTIAVLKTRAEPLGWNIVVGDPSIDLEGQDVFGAIAQYPTTYGELRDFRPVAERLHAQGAIAILAADPLAITIITPPGEMDADIAIGSLQRFGMPMGFGGPHAAYIATKDKYKRSLPGRLVGVSLDARGRPAYRLALQTREQHIRREKATSNICTAQVLPAVIASMYAVYHGKEGLAHIAREVNEKASRLAHGLRLLGWKLVTKMFFDTVTIDAGPRKPEILERALRSGLNLRNVNSDSVKSGLIAISLDETTTESVVEGILKAFGGDIKVSGLSLDNEPSIAADMQRHSDFLNHPVFREHQSETNLVRYMRKLSDRDLALDRAMIPLGSCTMKLNAASEMMPITWSELCDIHPYAPQDQVRGYQELADELISQLCDITGYDGISLQPNSGAQGEFAGLLAIRAYHRSRGEARRNICLIPQSAHGTNPASAQMAGMQVIVVRCDEDGNVDLNDLQEKVTAHSAELAAIMITYPSTHGVFEDRIKEICELIHAHGGQVYLDGANMNAQVGLARPGKYGADVSHLNLHKTFCIPHGGGGPGMGPIGVKSHLIPFLPGDPRSQTDGVGPVSAANIGSACILAISWSYIAMMGSEGLKRASEMAILNANYIAERLQDAYPILYRGSQRRVAHECIVDIRPLQERTGVSVEDIAKRLIDYGFHAPTMSFPVTGTFMIEPTESESKVELDRFCDAMIAIKREINQIADGAIKLEGSPLKHAPHSVADLLDENWNRSYTRSTGVMPLPHMSTDKYWAPVNRVDNVHGDRNLVCSCPPMSSYLDAAE